MNLDLIDSKVGLDFSSEDELLSSILISLFSDARANDDEFEGVKTWEPSKRGYWGEQLDGVNYGSKLWLLKRAPKDEETLEKAKIYAKEALDWLVSGGGEETLKVKTSYEQDAMLIDIALKGKEYSLKYRE